MEKTSEAFLEEWEQKACAALKDSSIKWVKWRGFGRPGGVLVTWPLAGILIFLIAFQALVWGLVLGALWFGQ